MTADIRKPPDAERVIAKAVEHFGRLDVLINNAGGSPHVPAADASPRFVEAIVNLNLLAPLWCAQSAHKVMAVQEDGGSIVNVSSVSGMRPSPGASAYGAAKAGLINLTATLAVEWAPVVRVNCVTAGLLDTGAGDDFYGGPEGMERAAATVPVGRMGTPADVAEACLYLSSDAAVLCDRGQPGRARGWGAPAVPGGRGRTLSGLERRAAHCVPFFEPIRGRGAYLLDKTVKLAVTTETRPGERRVALVPDVAKKLVSAGWEVCVQAPAGTEAAFSDKAYSDAGATVAPDAAATLAGAGLVVRVNPPSAEDAATVPEGAAVLSFFGVAQADDSCAPWPPRRRRCSASTSCPVSAGPRAWTP